MGKLDGKTAIIIGAARGIGKDIALVFAREGARVVVSDRDEKEGDSPVPGGIETTVKRIRDQGGAAIGLRCDVTNEAQIESLMTEAVAALGRIDILVNDAAVQPYGLVQDIPVRHWDLAFRVNVRGPFLTARAILPHMKANGWGQIINITSGASRGPGKGPYTTVPKRTDAALTAYGASKAALERLTQGLAQEVWRDNIGVNALHPAGAVMTEGALHLRGQDLAGKKGWRLNGEMMGDAAIMICCKEPSVFTGNVISDEEMVRLEGGDPSRYPVVQ